MLVIAMKNFSKLDAKVIIFLHVAVYYAYALTMNPFYFVNIFSDSQALIVSMHEMLTNLWFICSFLSINLGYLPCSVTMHICSIHIYAG